MPIEVQRVTAAATAPLRQKVLRPHQSVEDLAREPDSDGGVVHFAALDHGEVIGTASLRSEAPAWAPDHHPSWRLRGMATAEDRRGDGVGSALLDAVVDQVRRAGGGLLWCNARTPALAFYQRAGLVTRGESWEDPEIGPHNATQAAPPPPGYVSDLARVDARLDPFVVKPVPNLVPPSPWRRRRPPGHPVGAD